MKASKKAVVSDHGYNPKMAVSQPENGGIKPLLLVKNPRIPDTAFHAA